KDKNSSFVTISFGTQNTPPTLVASAIENMLTRFYSYNKDYSINEDLIYCVQKDDSYSDVSEKMGTSPEEINNYNDTVDKSIILPGETLVNPQIESIRPFNQHVPINLSVEKTIWSK
ncbi:MAG: LysM peptidoglycan-binding domain-containing protein, partial [Clostridia bacterium]|nr:LysM peptidoglycan-binding domain-containing protein [Clostridia bacterium]